ncbi:hypothetical protein MTBBW1_1040046 [Desulfamplus magnetovallimortis]|uniref:Uncharacterized protein n=1 Tax=Desulfamplus magnetovallimortis TaxID=1246637 RepID=A0A1W1H536_9BACT|nr:hypothetical protein MTBBW1_1040046 [Desulfamplus magnetovallimortis]
MNISKTHHFYVNMSSFIASLKMNNDLKQTFPNAINSNLINYLSATNKNTLNTFLTSFMVN